MKKCPNCNTPQKNNFAFCPYCGVELKPVHSKNKAASNLTLNNLVSPSSPDPVLYQVASYFECSCEDCQDHELTSCQCPTANSQRNFIQNQLDQGKSPDEVRMLVYETYGNAKSQYADWFKAQLATSGEASSY